MSVASKRLERLEALAEQQRAQRIATQERQWNAALAAISREDRQVLIEWYDLLEADSAAFVRCQEAAVALSEQHFPPDDKADLPFTEWMQAIWRAEEDSVLPMPPPHSVARFRRAAEEWNHLVPHAERESAEALLGVKATRAHAQSFAELARILGAKSGGEF